MTISASWLTPAPSKGANTFLVWLGLLIIAIAFAGSAVLGLLTTYVVAVVILVALVAVAFRRQLPWSSAPDELVFTSIFAALLIDFTLAAGPQAGAASAFNFIAFLLYGPVTKTMDAARRNDGIVIVAWLALAGVGAAFLICLIQYFFQGLARPSGFASDTIRFANTAVIMGFLALAGFSHQSTRTRFIFLAGPILALAVIVFTGTRIAMVSYPPVLAIAVLMLAPRRWRLPMLGGAVGLICAVAAGLWLSRNARFLSMLDALQGLLNGTDISDTSIRIRLDLYHAGIAAFQRSPLIGHGWSNMMRDTIPLMRNPQEGIGLPHLHNELLSLSVAAGLVGVAVYLVLLAAPVFVAIYSPRDSQHSQRVFTTALVAASYAFMGMTDTMLTFELHTMLYVVICATILRFCRDRQPLAEQT